jgi:ribosomal protein S19
MSRSKWKKVFISIKLKKINKEKKIIVWSRASVIPEFFINKNVFVYNGKIFKKLLITREKVGFKFGEFIFTKIKPKLRLKKSKKKIT